MDHTTRKESDDGGEVCRSADNDADSVGDVNAPRIPDLAVDLLFSEVYGS